MVTFLDFNMLRTLPEGQVRNGFAGKSAHVLLTSKVIHAVRQS